MIENKLLEQQKTEVGIKGVLLDGWPRTLIQTKKLDELLQKYGMQVDMCFEFAVSKEEEDLLIERIEGRRVHKESGRTYHIEFNPPISEGIDDQTGEEL